LKLNTSRSNRTNRLCSIHPQGWVPIETLLPSWFEAMRNTLL